MPRLNPFFVATICVGMVCVALATLPFSASCSSSEKLLPLAAVSPVPQQTASLKWSVKLNSDRVDENQIGERKFASDGRLPERSQILELNGVLQFGWNTFWDHHGSQLVWLLTVSVLGALGILFVLNLMASRRAKLALRRRRTLERVISDFSARLNTSSAENFDFEMESGLERVRAVVDADRICWYIKQQTSPDMIRLYSTSSPAALESPVVVQFEKAPYLLDTLVRGEPVILDRLEDLPAVAMTDLLNLAKLNIKSLALLPSSRGTMEKGVLGLSSYSERNWTADLIGQLGVLSNVIGAAVERIHLKKERQASEDRFRCLVEQASVGIALEMTSGKLLLVNPAFCSIIGYPREELLQLSCVQLTHPDDIEKEAPLFEDLQKGLRSSYQLEKRFVCKDRSVIWAQVSVSLLKLPDGDPLVIGMLRDITDNKNAERLMKSSWALLHSTLDALPSRIAILDNVGRIIAVNSPWRELADSAGMKYALHGVGTNFFNVCAAASGDDARAARAASEMAHSLLRGDSSTGDLLQMCRTAKGEEVWYQIGMARFEESDSPRVVISYRDVTELMRTREQLAQNRESLSMALEASRAGTWEWNLVDGEIRWTAAGDSSVLQQARASPNDYGKALELIYPDDRARLRSALEEALTTSRPFSCEFRVTNPEGPLRWILAKGKTHWRDEGRIPRVQGVYVDVTDLKQREIDIQSLPGRLIQAQEDERKRISRELHDDVGQRLSLIGVELDQLTQNLLQSSSVKTQLFKLLDQTKDIAADIHHLSHELHSTKLQHLGLKAALKDLCRQISGQRDIAIDFEATRLSQAIPPDVALCLFRVAQEGLSNAAKHSKAKRVSVEIQEIHGAARLRLKDFGVGFDPTLPSQGIGLASMRERLKILGGTFTVQSGYGEGTELVAEVPIGQLTMAKHATQS